MAELSVAERELVEKFRKLDDEGKGRIQRLLDQSVKAQPFWSHLKQRGINPSTLPIEEIDVEYAKFREETSAVNAAG